MDVDDVYALIIDAIGDGGLKLPSSQEIEKRIMSPKEIHDQIEHTKQYAMLDMRFADSVVLLCRIAILEHLIAMDADDV